MISLKMSNHSDFNITYNLTNSQIEAAPISLTVVLIATSLWIIIINALVLSCLITSRSAMKSYVNLQLLSLSVTDMLVGVFSIPVTLTFKIARSFPTYGVCASLFYLYIVSQAATLNHALVICIHRLITVKRKHRNAFVVQSKYLSVFLQLLSVWLVSFVVISIPFLLYGRFDENLLSCSLNTLFEDDYTSAIAIFTSALLIPHICLNLVYLYMLLYLKRKWRQINSTNVVVRTKWIGGRSSGQTITPIEITDLTNSGHCRNELNACGSTTKQNHQGIRRHQTTTRLVGIKTDASSVASTMNSQGKLQVERFTGRGGETLNGRKAGDQLRLSGIEGQKRVLMTIGILLVILNVFMTPLDCLTVFESLHTGYLSRTVKFIFMNMAILNSALNPIINVFRIKPFKDALKQKALIFWRLFCR